MTRGAFTAVVDLTTGAVTQAARPVQPELLLAGLRHRREGGASRSSPTTTSERNETRLIGGGHGERQGREAAEAARPGHLRRPASPTAYAAAQGARLVRVGSTGDVRVAARTAASPSSSPRHADGSVVVHRPARCPRMKARRPKPTTERAEVRRAPAALLGATGAAGATQRLATGALTDFDLARAARTGAVYVTGRPRPPAPCPPPYACPRRVAKDAGPVHDGRGRRHHRVGGRQGLQDLSAGGRLGADRPDRR